MICTPVIPRGCLILALLLFAGFEASSQSVDDQKIHAVLEQLFKGMELGDSALVRSCFMANPTIASVRANREGNTILSRDANLQAFLNAVGTPHADKWYEEVWNVKVSIDGQFAQVWCDYAFYLGNKFSHCGVDAFHFFKEGDRWKIFHLSDTRRTEQCDIPARISGKVRK